jgi:hypothetical protein
VGVQAVAELSDTAGDLVEMDRFLLAAALQDIHGRHGIAFFGLPFLDCLFWIAFFGFLPSSLLDLFRRGGYCVDGIKSSTTVRANKEVEKEKEAGRGSQPPRAIVGITKSRSARSFE